MLSALRNFKTYLFIDSSFIPYFMKIDIILLVVRSTTASTARSNKDNCNLKLSRDHRSVTFELKRVLKENRNIRKTFYFTIILY